MGKVVDFDKLKREKYNKTLDINNRNKNEPDISERIFFELNDECDNFEELWKIYQD